MAQDDFQKECDRLSDAVNADYFERFRWERDEAPKLARLVELVESSFGDRRDFDLAEEGATHGFKKYVLKVHSERTVAITVRLKNGNAILTAEQIERSPYTLSSDGAVGTKYENVDEVWIAAAMKTLLGRICAPPPPPEPESQPAEEQASQ